MATNLIDDMSQALGSGGFGWLSSAVGESPEATERAARASAPVMLGGLSVLGSTQGGAGQILNFVRGGRFDEPDALSRVAGVGSDPGSTGALMDHGRSLLGPIFGSKLDGVVSDLQGSTGVKRSTISALLAVLAPVSLALIGRKVRDENLDASGLAATMRMQHGSLSRVLPASLTGMLGLGALAPRAYSRADIREQERLPRSRSWWPWVAFVLVGALAVFLFSMNQRRHRTADLRRPEITVPAAPWPTAPAKPTARQAAPAQPAATAPERAEGGRVAGTAIDPDALGLIDIRFAVDSADPQPARAIDRVAAILVEHPSARIRVVGHTDSTGSPDHNAELASLRADAVRGALIAKGVAASRIEVAAESAAQPVATNATDTGRRRNRRVEVELIGQ